MADTTGIDDPLSGLDKVSLRVRPIVDSLNVDSQLPWRHSSTPAIVEPVNRADIRDTLVAGADVDFGTTSAFREPSPLAERQWQSLDDPLFKSGNIFEVLEFNVVTRW